MQYAANSRHNGTKTSTHVRNTDTPMLSCCHINSSLQFSVVTGQAPITLERKITSEGKQILRKKQKIVTQYETNRTLDWTKKVRSAYVHQDTYHRLNESQQKPKPRRQHSTHKKIIILLQQQQMLLRALRMAYNFFAVSCGHCLYKTRREPAARCLVWSFAVNRHFFCRHLSFPSENRKAPHQCSVLSSR